MIQIHPIRSYLNSDVVISNKGLESVTIEDSITHESFRLSPGEYRSSRFPAGEHKLGITWLSGTIEEQSFVVEDALKFGGSEKKCSYVFDNNPWAIIVMKDRTYFLNEETKEQFVEYNLSPDSIEEIGPGYLLFSTGKDCSFFSLSSMAFEKTLSLCECVYYGYGHCVLSSTKGLYLYRLDPQFNGQRLSIIRCDDFIINKEEGIIYTFDKGSAKEFCIIKLVSVPENNEYEHITRVEIDGKFVCFLSCHVLLYTKSDQENGNPNMLYIKNLSQMGSSSLLYNGEQPISSINGINIWDTSSYDELYKQYGKDKSVSGEGRRLSIDVIENSKKCYYIQTVETVTINNKKTATSITSNLYAQGALIEKSISKKLSFNHRGIFDYVSSDNHTILFYNDSYKIIYDGLRFTNFNDPYTHAVWGKRNIYSSIDGVRINHLEGRSHPEFGLFFINDKEPKFYWLKNRKKYVGESIKTVDDIAIVMGGHHSIPPRFFMGNGDIIPVPKDTDSMIAHSATWRAILYETGGYYVFARLKDKKWEFSENLVLSIYDTLRVKDAVFCSDGDSFIYQKENALVLFDFISGNETVFESNTGIKNNINGYRPYCTRDYFSRPVIIDPLSHRAIDNNFLCTYRFSNIEGDVFFEKSIIRHYLIKDNSEVSRLQYEYLCKEYDYTFPMDEGARAIARRKRIRYCEESLHRKIDLFFSIEVTTPRFVDSYLVKTVEYVVINRHGSLVEIQIGTPLYFLNYVAFSPDSNTVAICGKYQDSSGLCLVYDFNKEKVIHHSIQCVGKTKAIWLGLFSKNEDIAYYDSTPNTYFLRKGKITIINGRSFLTFSPSGDLMAMSKQGYTPYSDDSPWGHRPSCDIYIARTTDPTKCLCHFNDHGTGIVGIGDTRETIASASFSIDDKKILSVSMDGVVVVRNLHLDENMEISK